MSKETDSAYFRRREQAARERATDAGDPHIARIHAAMAARYADAARDAAVIEARDPA